MSTKKRFLTLVLTLVLVFCCLPTTAFSVDNKAVGVEESVEIADTGISYLEQETESDELIGAVSELTALREENVKHFRLSNGLYQAVTYATPVHRKDKDGVWQDIDNSLELKAVEDVKCYSTTDSRVSFASEFKYGTELFYLRENGYSIALTPVTSGKITASTYPSVTTVKNSEKRSATVFDTVEEASRIDNQTKIMYTNIEESTDIEYVLRGNDIKENIIVNAPTSSYKYSFYLNLTGLVAKLDEYGNVIIADEKTKDVKYTIPAPYMFDDNGEVSYDVYYELKSSGESRYLLTVTANEKWINEEGRAFPVTIDPTVTQYNGIQDAMVNSSSVNANYGSLQTQYLADGKSIYIRAEMPALPIGATISAAWFAMSYYFSGSSGSMLAGAYQVLSSWNESTITYNNAPPVGDELLSSAILSAFSSITSTSPNETSFEITSLANQWYDGTADNYGIIIKRLESATHTLTNARIKSSETDYLPYLNITYSYKIPDGVYALRNAYGSTYWMTVNGNAADGGTIQQKTSTSSPANADVFDRTSLFKITHNGSFYVIRSMLNNNLTISISGTSIVTKEIPNKDADVASRDRFYIEWTGTGYLIRPVGTSNVIAMTESFETNLTVVPKTSATVMANWNLVQYTGNHKSGGIIYYPSEWSNHGIIEGTDSEISMVGWSTYPDANVIEASVPQEDAVLGGIEWDSTTRRGTFSAYSPGCVTVAKKTYQYDGILKSTGTWEFSIVPQAGTYYIRNVQSGKYVETGTSTAEGTLVHQWDFNTSDQEKWVIEYVPNSGGYIRFKSAYSNLYLGIDSSNTTVVKQYVANNYTSWKIDRTVSGNYILINKATESSGNVLAVPLGTTINGTNLTQLTHVDDTKYNDEWELYIINYFAVVNNYYDYGYTVRYDESEETSRQNIYQYCNAVAEVYVRQLGLEIQFGTAEYYGSVADVCKGTVTSENVTVECNHSGQVHTERDTLILDFLGSHTGSETVTNVLWSGHKIMSTSSNEERQENRSCSSGTSIYVLKIAEIDRANLSQSVLLHELNHQFGAKDHYHEEMTVDGETVCKFSDICSDCGTTPRPFGCVMNSSTQEITSDDIFCSDCLNEMREHLESHHRY